MATAADPAGARESAGVAAGRQGARALRARVHVFFVCGELTLGFGRAVSVQEKMFATLRMLQVRLTHRMRNFCSVRPRPSSPETRRPPGTLD